MSERRDLAPNPKARLTLLVTPVFIFDSFLAIVVISFIPVCGHYLLASDLVCIPSTHLLIGVVCARDAYSFAHYAPTYIASAIGLTILTTLRISVAIPAIPMPVWYVSKVVAAPVGCFAMQLLAAADPELGGVDGPSLLDPASMLVAALVGQGVVWIIVRLICTASFWQAINGCGGPGMGRRRG
ncbi:hypothetical protein BD309DRAFT_950612 [Dichomitus squalens]|uniref:Uncharacterized protein n=1 Tax=Dichomitus squalens TaxID=114155 RepID=A0A4V2K5D7_9APHY|nr:uncharacterized protein DICSQDRAFT_165400 [Dichomitus squalens LYAD-421 SS1]EJF65689.1 hypothetical protein DICSQDRAFT_165400 [Dichomitus squalens LYAD-421 SS1]TBU32311.1 hypothetical protein BD311DRAFT_862690 [Dichomitus squalens]TBU47963.1 hypothetical protein BD309DRAFT_950612 [Dichomitus squalens]